MILMQASSSVDGQLHTWSSEEPDFDGTGYPGDGDPIDIAISSSPTGGAGSAEVAADVAKSAGSTIDRVRGFTGVPFDDTDDGAAAAIVGAVPVYNEVGGATLKFKRPSPWVNVDDYGADPTGVADSSAAFQAAHDAIGGALAGGGTLFVPEGIYKLDSRVVIAKNVDVVGSGMTSGNGGTELRLAAGVHIVFCHYGMGQSYAAPSTAQGGSISGVGLIKTARATVTPWEADTAVTVGTRRIVTSTSATEMDLNRHVFIECIKAGTTHETDHPTPTQPDLFSAEFVPSRTYHYGELVRGSSDQLAIAADGANLITTVMFQVTTAGAAAGTRPTFDTTPGNTTVSGEVTFTAISVATFWMTDGTAVWAAKSDANLITFTRIGMTDIHTEFAGGPGVYIRGDGSNTPVTNANGWTARNIRSVQSGIGFMCHGSDTQAGAAMMIDVEGAGKGMPAGADPRTSGGVGIYDASGVGNAWVGCQVANLPNGVADATGGGYHSYLTNAGATWAQFINCYSEAHAGAIDPITAAHLPGSNTLVVGGAHSAGFTNANYPALDGTKTEAQLLLDVGQGGQRGIVTRTTIASGADQLLSGSTANITGRNPVNGVMTLTGLSGLVEADQGRAIQVSGAATGGYNTATGLGFVISSYLSSSSCEVINRKGSTSDTGADANNGSITWAIGGGDVSLYTGTRDQNGAVIGWTGPGYSGSNRNQFCYSGVFTDGGGWAGKDWWTWTTNGLKSNVSAFVSGVGSTFGVDGAAVGEPIFGVPSRVWFGDQADYLRSIEFSAAAPSSLRHAQGSLALNKEWDGTTEDPIGWMASATGTPGTWAAIYTGTGSGAGEANTASNAGAGAIQWANAKSGVDLPFKTAAVSSPLGATVASNVVTHNIGGLTTYGSVGQAMRVATGGTSLEWFTPSSGAGPDGNDGEVQTKNSTAFAGATNVKAGSGYLSIGANAATTGAIRLATGTYIVSRNNGNTANLNVCRTNASDDLEFWSTTGAEYGNILFNVPNAYSHIFQDNSVYRLILTNLAVRLPLPRIGYSTPYASEGMANIASGTHSLATTEYEMAIWTLNGGEGDVYTIPSAAANRNSYVKHIRQLGTACSFTDGTRTVAIPASGTSGGGTLHVTPAALDYVYGTVVAGT